MEMEHYIIWIVAILVIVLLILMAGLDIVQKFIKK